MYGIVLLYKDRGMTSADCVSRCRRIFKTRRVGHSGTLDPNVDGVLPICIGKATKVVNYLMASGKIYRGEVTLGFATETEDLDGAKIAEEKLAKPFSDAEIDAAMAKLTGEITQIPPMYSAVKVRGRRLYEYARAGEKVERPRRKALIKYFTRESSEFDSETGYQKIKFEVGCGKGTYVRTLAVDLGKILGVPAVMSDLTRIKSGGFTIDQAVSLDQLNECQSEEDLEKYVFPVDHALENLPQVRLSASQWKIVKNGGFLSARQLDVNAAKLVALQYDGRIRCVYHHNDERGRYQPETMIDLD